MAMPFARGTRFGPYEIRNLLGVGGMGEVYRAFDARLGREVALKILPAHLANDSESLARFRLEARAVAALSHANIVAVFDVGRDDETQFVVTELLEGETLRSRLSRGAMKPGEMLNVAIAIADGLAAAHAKGIIHRDLKPDNVFLTASGGVKILDFGLASIVPQLGDAAIAHGTSLTAPGIVVGTVGYMSPEQLSAKRLTPATDVFAFGCVAYEMLRGETPFRGDTGIEVMASVLRDDPFAGERGAGIPRELRALIERCLSKDPAQRFANGGELRDALRAIAEEGSFAPTVRTRPVPRVRRRRTAAVALVTAIAIVALALIARTVSENRRVIDDGYDLRASDITGTPDTRHLVDVALHADALGDRSAALELLREAARKDPNAPLPAAFLASFSWYGASHDDARRWDAELRRRLPYSHSTYEAMLCRYLIPVNSSATEMALAASLLDLRPHAWRLRLALAHLHLSRRELAATLDQLKQIDVSAPDDRRLAIVLADRASLGDIAGAQRDLQRCRLMSHPALLAYTRGRMAWSAGRAAEALREFDAAVDAATASNLHSVEMESRILAGIARIGTGDFPGAQTAFEVAAMKARQQDDGTSELQAHAFAAYAAWRRGDPDAAARDLQAAASLAEPSSPEASELRLMSLRTRQPVRAAPPTPDETPVATLLRAREAWAAGATVTATRLLAESRAEGVDTTWFSEEAALLAKDLGQPHRSFRPDPPYPNLLRFLAVWELGVSK